MYVHIPECGSCRVGENSSLGSKLHHRVEESSVNEEKEIGIETRHHLHSDIHE